MTQGKPGMGQGPGNGKGPPHQSDTEWEYVGEAPDGTELIQGSTVTTVVSGKPAAVEAIDRELADLANQISLLEADVARLEAERAAIVALGPA